MDRENLRIEIEKTKKEMQKTQEKLHLLMQELKKEKEKLAGYRQEAEQISENLDAWVDSFTPTFPVPVPGEGGALLFLGTCSGEWAARTRYRGRLPGFGGFLLLAEDKRILVDPGQGTFSGLISDAVGIHPSLLDTVIVTHSHRDCVHDLELITMAASFRDGEPVQDKKNRLSLLADQTVLFGRRLAKDLVSKKLSQTKIYKDNTPAKNKLKNNLEKFEYDVPGALNVYDLLYRLEGRFTQIAIDKSYDLHPLIKLYTRRSYCKLPPLEDR